MQISRLAIVPEELVCVTWRRGGDGALLCPKQMDLKKDNVSRFSWEKVICCVPSADSEEWDAQNSRNFSLMTHFN